MKRILVTAMAIVAIAAVAAASAGRVGAAVTKPRDFKYQLGTRVALLYMLQASFHRISSVSNPVTGDSQATIDQRIQKMMALWASDGSVHLMVGNPAVDGNYVGNPGPSVNPEDTTACPPVGSGDPRGNLCTFYRYVAGSFKPQNKLISLSPAYATAFDIQGNTAKVYFQCHYFDVSSGDTWTPVLHIAFNGTATWQGGHWLLQHAEAPKLVNSPPLP
jgi:hypothetical protein